MSLAATVSTWSRTSVPSDDEIARRVVAGELALFEVLMRRNNQRLYRAIRSVVPDEAEVEELMQQAYVQAYGALSGFQHASKFSTWLIRIGLNAALASKRRASRFESLPEDTPSSEEAPVEFLKSDQPSPEDRAGSRELGHILESVLDGLPQLYRTVLMLREVEGLSTAETADVLAVTEEVVKTRLHRAKLLARDTLYAKTEHQAAESFQFHAPRCDRVVAAVLEHVFAAVGKT
jgi:RNA polymerase sigma-70 factor, ECF subfamily